MTLIVGWASLDNKPNNEKAISAIYLLSDSRITWKDKTAWNKARKIFHFQNHPDILGYCGEVLFPTQIISQVISLADSGLLFKENDDFNAKSKVIFDKIKNALENYPLEKLYPSFSIIHGSKTRGGSFGVNILRWRFQNGWEEPEKVELPKSTGIFSIEGSGTPEFNSKFDKKKTSKMLVTSGEIFQSFIDTLNGSNTNLIGGAPQLVGIYSNNISKTFGVVAKDKRYYLGIEIVDNESFGNIEWRNELFEECDPATKLKLKKAKKRYSIK